MKGKGGTPTSKRPKALGNSMGIDSTMTPDTFERSQSKLKSKTSKRRRSLNESYGGDITQLAASFTEDDSMVASDDELTPATLSQISAIDPNVNDTYSTTFARKKRSKGRADNTLEIAVEYARGEPDGAERSFTRKNLSKMSLADDDVKENGSDGMEVDGDDAPSPIKRSKITAKEEKTPVSREKKGTLKIPFKQATKKLASLKNPAQLKKTKKQVNKNFEALPDETTVPKTPNNTWKEKKKERKMMKNNYDLISGAKRAWEELRREKLPADKRQKICNDLMKMVLGKVKELCMVHDSSRVIQCLVQYGSEKQREIIFEEIKKNVVEISKSKYSKFVLRKLIHYGSKPLKAEVMKCFHGHVRKLIKHKEASEIIEYAFNDYATAPQRLALLEEFYGPSFFLYKDEEHQSLEQVMTHMPEKKELVLKSMKESLMPLINKELISHSMVHKAFFDFFTYATESSKKDIVEGLKDHIPHLLHTRDGTRVAMHCVWAGSTKDRKAIVKSLKTHVVKACKEEHGHLLLLSIFDSVDDTVLVQKVIIDELLKSLGDVITNLHGRKVLLYCLAPREPTHFHPDVVKILAEGDANSHSKKDKAVRAKELRSAVSPKLLKYLEENAGAMMTNSNMALLLKAIVTNSTGDAGPAMRAVANFIAIPSEEEEEATENATDKAMSMVEHPACHIAMKKIIANDRTRMEQGEGILFSAILLEALPKSTIKVWAASNRGCFVLISLLDVGCSTVTERVTEQLKPLRKFLGKMTFQGAQLLLDKLDNKNISKGKEFRV